MKECPSCNETVPAFQGTWIDMPITIYECECMMKEHHIKEKVTPDTKKLFLISKRRSDQIKRSFNSGEQHGKQSNP